MNIFLGIFHIVLSRIGLRYVTKNEQNKSIKFSLAKSCFIITSFFFLGLIFIIYPPSNPAVLAWIIPALLTVLKRIEKTSSKSS